MRRASGIGQGATRRRPMLTSVTMSALICRRPAHAIVWRDYGLRSDFDRLMMPDGKLLTSRALIAVALALAASLSGCGGGGGRGPLDVVGLNYPNAKDYPIHGIDVSKFQGDIDWNAVANSGVKFAWIKATEGGDRFDQHFQANWTGAKAAGVPHGAYHFVYWCRPPLEEMSFFEQNAPVEDDALPPVLDVEATPTSKTCHRHLTEAGRHRRDEGDAGGDGTPLWQTADHLHDGRLLPGDSFGRRLYGLSDLGPLDQVPPRGQIWAAALAFLAIPIRRPGRRHPGPCRPRRVLWDQGAVGRLPP